MTPNARERSSPWPEASGRAVPASAARPGTPAVCACSCYVPPPAYDAGRCSAEPAFSTSGQSQLSHLSANVLTEMQKKKFFIKTNHKKKKNKFRSLYRADSKGGL